MPPARSAVAAALLALIFADGVGAAGDAWVEPFGVNDVEAAAASVARGASVLPALGGGKCGVAVSADDEGGGIPFNVEMLRLGAANGLAWHTHWHAGSLQTGFSTEDYGDVRLVPQIWGDRLVHVDPVQRPLAGVLLGFNEPDQSKLGGSGVGVDEAIELWMSSVGKAQRMGYTMFVAPSIAQSLPKRYSGVKDASEWLPDFLDLCLATSGCPETITFLGFHLYEPRCITDPEEVRHWAMEVRVGSMKRLMAEYNDRGMNIQGLWLTEFAGRSDEKGLCRTLEQQRGWMEVVVPLLNEEPSIVAYSWFSYGEGRSPFFKDNANLWDYETNQLTTLGEAYFTLCDGRQYAPVDPTPTVLPQSLPVHAKAPQQVQRVEQPAEEPVEDPFAIAAGSGGSASSGPWRWLPTFAVLLLMASICFGYAMATGRGSDADGVSRAIIAGLDTARRWLHYDLARLGNRFGFAHCQLCDDGVDDPLLTDSEMRGLEAFRAKQPELAWCIEVCCVLVVDRQRFERESDAAFEKLFSATASMPLPPPESTPSCMPLPMSQAPAPCLDSPLAEAPAKEKVWDFLLTYMEARPHRQGMVAELIAQLEATPYWLQALASRPDLARRRNHLAFLS